MKKGAWVAVGVASVALIAAGVRFGPDVYGRFFGRVTPLGAVTRLEDAGVAGAGGGERIWAVHFNPKPSAAEAAGKTQVFSESSIDLSRPTFPGPALGGKSDPMRETYIVDHAGEKHSAVQAKGKLLTQPVEGKPDSVTLHFRLEKLIFSLPQDRRPELLQVGDAPAVHLPDAG